MIRRKFINLFSSFAGSLFVLPGSIFGALFKPQNITSQKLIIKNLSKGKQVKKIRFIIKFKQVYISLTDFASSNDFNIFTNSSKRKTVLYIDRDKAKFTADNGFVVLNDQLYQYNYEPFWKDMELWVPAEVLADLFSSYTAHKMEFNSQKMEFVIGKKNVNITNVKISTKENGTLIQILSEKSFTKKDISLKISNNWLHVDIYGGLADGKAISKHISTDVISEIQAIQFEQLVSLAFKLKKKIETKELILNADSNDIFVNLKTSVDLGKENKAKEDLDQQKKQWMINTIVIDAGHGGKDPGAVGYKGLKEKDIVLSVALKLGKMIAKNNPSVKIIYTRKTDVFIPLWKRTKIANENNGKLFISLHCNGNYNKKVSGFDTWFLSADKDDRAKAVVLKENESIKFEGMEDKKRYEGVNFILATMAQNAFIKQSQYLASVVQKSLSKKLKPIGMKDLGVKQGGFWVMVGATMPNILVEMGHISNKFEANLLKQKSTQTKLANAIYNGIAKYKKDIEDSI